MKQRRLCTVIFMIACVVFISGIFFKSSIAFDSTQAGVPQNEEITAPIQKILQDRVIEVTYSDFDFDEGIKYFDELDNFEAGGCSAVKVLIDGKVYVGRNYDFYCSNAPAFVVRNNAGKYRTIGIGNSPESMPEWTENYQLNDDVLKYLPMLCADVMSEAGIYAETNIREHEDGLECKSTNPGKPRLCTQNFLQLMLSNYGSIAEILSHIDDYDWFDITDMGFNQSIMLTDRTGYSIVIEFAENSWKYTEVDYNSNFFIDNEFYAKEKYPAGEMRTSRELAYKPFVRSKEDIFTMMSKGFYAKFYTANVDLDDAISEYLSDLGYTRFNIDENREEARKKMKEMLEEYDTYTWDELVANHCWETTFSIAANVTDRKMDVHFSEHYGIQFTVDFG